MNEVSEEVDVVCVRDDNAGVRLACVTGNLEVKVVSTDVEVNVVNIWLVNNSS